MLKKSILCNALLWNIVAFNIIWFGLIFIGNGFIPIAAIMLCIHIWQFQAFKSEILLICLVATIGILLDTSLVYAGIFTFPNTIGIPFWLTVLWFCFACTIRHSLAFLANSKLMQLVFGALLAPLSYLAGANLSVVQLSPSLAVSYLILACLWGPLMVLIFALSRWLQAAGESHVT